LYFTFLFCLCYFLFLSYRQVTIIWGLSLRASGIKYGVLWSIKAAIAQPASGAENSGLKPTRETAAKGRKIGDMQEVLLL
jgi:hypothetical protein